jgi:hypothetical protein
MGKLPHSAIEVRLAATLFLLLLGVANLFGAWQVGNFSSFTPEGAAAAVAPRQPEGSLQHQHHSTSMSMAHEEPVDLASLDQPHHVIDRNLLVQDTHVHLPAYALTAAALSLIVCGLALGRRTRVGLVLLAFLAPAGNFTGLWGAHLLPRAGLLFGTLTVVSGFAMGFAYLIVLAAACYQCWIMKPKLLDPEPDRS